METKAGNLLKRIVVIMIVFSMMLLDGFPILSNVSLAVEDPETQVEVNGYFSLEGTENTNSLVCDVKNQTIKINFDVSIKGDGYLKNGAIKFGNDLNFMLNPDEKTFIKDNQLKLPEINATAALNVSIPISFENKKSYKLEDLSKTNTIVFKGEYVDSENIIHAIQKELTLDLTWTENTESLAKYELIKNLDFERDGNKGKILQTKLNILQNSENNLPIKSTEIVVDIPTAEGLELVESTVEVTKLSFTQGREDYNTDFTKANYRVEEGKIIINVNNNENEGFVNRAIGEDSYILTFLYNGEINDSVVNTSKVSAKISNFAGNEENIETGMTCDLNEAIGETVQYFKENKETPIALGYLVADSNQEKYEITYVEKDVLNINRADLVAGLQINDVDEYFIDELDNKYDVSESVYYKKTEFSKENLVNILGENGKVEILNTLDEVIGTVNVNEEEANESGMIVIEYTVPISAVKIKFSDPIADGNITAINTKAIKSLNYSRAVIRDFTKLVSHAEGFVTYDDGIITDLDMVETSIDVSKTQSSATMEILQPELSTVVTNENVNFKIRLNNNEDISDLYENPIFEIKLPKAITDIKIKNIDLFYANGELEISSVETITQEDCQIVRISLEGMQSSYNINKETNGTVISFDADLSLNEMTGNITEAVEMTYYNAGSMQYNNEKDWSMMLNIEDAIYLKNGYDSVDISYRGPEGLVNGQTTETKEEPKEEEVEEPKEDNEEEKETNNNKVISLNQGPESDLLEEGVEAKLATMYISILNNTSRNYNNFKILGRIPFIGNKEITTGKDLGTTVDTILDTEIIATNPELPYTIYYSENGEATEDLYDENNGWKSDFYKGGAVKSYLIVLNEEYVLESNSTLEFTYDYVIPANLQAGDSFYGTYATYFTETSTQISNNSSADKIGYEIESKTDIEASVRLKSDKVKELSTSDYEVVVTNNSEVDAKDLAIVLEVPNEFSSKNDNTQSYSKTDTTKNVIMEIGDVEANSEKVYNFSFYINKFINEENNVKTFATVSGRNLNNDVNVETEEVVVEKTKLEIVENYYGGLMVAGTEYRNNFMITNVSGEDYHNLKISKKLGGSFEFKSVSVNGIAANRKLKDEIYREYFDIPEGVNEEEYMNEMSEKLDAIEEKKLNVVEEYDRDTNVVTWTIENFEQGDTLQVDYNILIKINAGEKGINIDKINTMYDFNDGNTVLSYDNNIKYNQSNIDIQIENRNDVGYAKEGDELTYIWEIVNNNDYAITDFTIAPQISEEADIISLSLETENTKKSYHADTSKTIFAILEPKSISRLIVTARVNKYLASDEIKASVNANYDNVYENNVEVTTELENKEVTGNQMSGTAYIDVNNNQRLDEEDTVLSGVIANLYNSETNELVATQVTDIQGRYEFKNLDEAIYYVKFNYDNSEYAISSEKTDSLSTNKSSILKMNNDTVTDNITIGAKSIAGIDIPLQNDDIFDMKLDAYVEKLTVQNSAERTEYIPENKDLGKVDIDPDLLSDTEVFIEYKVIVKNQGTMPGKVNKIVDYTPDGMKFDSSLNSDWYLEADGNIVTTVLQNDEILPGDTRELTLILSRKLTEDSTGVIYNSIEIATTTNERGMTDIDSVPGNKLNEDDLAVANAIIGIKTGVTARKATMMMLALVIVIIIVVLVWRYIDKRRYV